MVSAACRRLPSSPVVTLFSFQRAGAPRDLHSFPTRRSSDLLEELDERALLGLRRLGVGVDRVADVEAVVRSEEHTSELQSPCNLVCRLLLEKKNRDKTRRRWESLTVDTPARRRSVHWLTR